MPNQPKAPNRNAGRINGRTWAAAAEAARINGEDRSTAIARALDAYAAETLDRLPPEERAAVIARIESAASA